jgi:hypothetical protein
VGEPFVMVELARPTERGWAVRAGESFLAKGKTPGELMLEVLEDLGGEADIAIGERLAAADNAGEDVHAMASRSAARSSARVSLSK